VAAIPPQLIQARSMPHCTRFTVPINLKNPPTPFRCQRPKLIFLELCVLAPIVSRNADVQSRDLLFFPLAFRILRLLGCNSENGGF
jgi:hypothetical protein